MLKVVFVIVTGFFAINAIIAGLVFYVLMTPSHRNMFGICQAQSSLPKFKYDVLHITTPDSIKLSAYFVKNEKSDCLAVVLHGYGSQAKNLVPYAEHFYVSGYNVLIPDLRGHGNAGGICGLGYKDAEDVMSWIEHVEKLTASKYRVIVFGTSMGATTAVNAALSERNHRIYAVIADSLAASFFEVIKKVYRWRIKYPWIFIYPFLLLYIRLIGGVKPEKLSLYERIQKLEVPVLFIHGKKDGLIDYNSVRDLYALVRCKKEIMLSDNADHIGMMKIEPDEYWKTIDNFIINNIQRKEELL